MPALVRPFVLRNLLSVRLLAVLTYYATFSNLNYDEVEVVNVVDQGSSVFSDEAYYYDLSLQRDPAYQPEYEQPETVDVFPQAILPSGTVVTGKKYSKTTTFHNIPYAEPPIGDLRFEDPVPFKQPATIDATDNGWWACIQGGGGYEDCLYLNVIVPNDYTYDPDNLLPVMVWIHGGGFASGSLDDGFDTLSNTTGTIIVSMNYRLGYLGFLTYDEAGISGNQGIKDQRMAMKWVHDNIVAFGGDKDKVTLFGQSAGAQSIEFHLVSEESRPYFSRAIVQSTYNVPYPTREDANTITDIMIKQFQLRFKCSFLKSGIECLKNIPYEELLYMNDYSQQATLTFWGARTEFAPDAPLETNVHSLWEGARPYIDGVDIKDQPSALYKTGQWSTEKDVKIGTCSGEYTVIEKLPYDVDKLRATMWANAAFGETVGSTLMDDYEKLYPSLNPAQQLGNAMTEQWFTCYARSIARNMDTTGTGDIFLYEFSQPSSAINLLTREPIAPQGKAVHSAEVEYVYGWPFLDIYSYYYTADDIFISKVMMEMWGNFAHEGIPNTSDLPNGWSKYTPDTSGNWPSLNIAADDFAVHNNVLDDVCNYWDDKGFWA